MKKLFMSVCLMFLSASALATVGKANTLLLDHLATAGRYQAWTLSRTGLDTYKVSSTGTTAYILVYVNRYIGNCFRESDPIRMICGGQPVIVNPGQGRVCKVTPFDPAVWKIEPEFVVNGTEGSIFYAE